MRDEGDISTTTEKNPRYNFRREQLFLRLRRVLADPVALLVATAYEPRVDEDPNSHSYNEIIANEQLNLRTELDNITTSKGGHIEEVALKTSERLHHVAEEHALYKSAETLQSALTRSREVKNNAGPQPLELPNIERVLGDNGRPIGIWR